MSALKNLEDMGYKPKKEKVTKHDVSESIHGKIEDKKKLQMLDLLIEGLTDSDAKEIIIYGMYVKKHLASMIPVSREKRVEKTLEFLQKMIEETVKAYYI
jgi:hypothetical protein